MSEHRSFETGKRPSDSAVGPALLGGVAAAAFVGALVLWSSSMSVASAAIAGGRISVEGNRKAIQHRDGGPIGRVLVREGQLVQAGQPLLHLDLSEIRAEVAVLENSRIVLLIRAARLRAEAADAAAFVLPAELAGGARDPQVDQVFQQELAVFASRREAYHGQISLLRQQIEANRRQIVALQGRIKATEAQLASIDDELKSLKPLLEKGYVARPRVLTLERTASGLQGELEGFNGLITAETDKIRGAEIQIAQLTKDRQETIARDMAESDAKLADILPRLKAAGERLDRGTLVAPEAGYVYGLSVFSTGATVTPGQTVLEIVPADDPLVVTAEISAGDINRVRAGQPVDIFLLPYRRYQQSPLRGTLEKVSADLVEEKGTNRSYYRGTVRLNREDLQTTQMELVPGMPAQVTIETGKRTILAYFLDPVFKVYDFALREQ
jgi:HlyD family type I secretion membrane fusion protein